jgi:hypothetical protein
MARLVISYRFGAFSALYIALDRLDAHFRFGAGNNSMRDWH